MKLIITEEMWGINHRSGEYNVRKTAKKVVPCREGESIFFEIGGRTFIIDKVDDSFVTFSMLCKNSEFKKTWTLSKRESSFYRTRSFDGGYQYSFHVK